MWMVDFGLLEGTYAHSRSNMIVSLFALDSEISVKSAGDVAGKVAMRYVKHSSTYLRVTAPDAGSSWWTLWLFLVGLIIFQRSQHDHTLEGSAL